MTTLRSGAAKAETAAARKSRNAIGNRRKERTTKGDCGSRGARSRPSARSTAPPTIVAAGAPTSSQPANGVLRPLETNRCGSTFQRASGSNRVTSAGEPGASVPAREAEHAGRSRREEGDESVEREAAASHEAVVDHGGRRLETHDPEGRRVEVHGLLVGVVRGVVGRDRVDRSVLKPREEGREVRRLAQRRVHLGARREARGCDLLVGQQEVVGRHLARHRDAVRLRPPHRAPEHARSRGGRRGGARPSSSAMSRSRATAAASAIAGWPARPRRAETAPSCIGDSEGERRVLAMLDDGLREEAGVLVRMPQDAASAASARRPRRRRRRSRRALRRPSSPRPSAPS